MKRILYIHHAGGIGGAPLSLLYLIQYLDRSRYEPVVAVLRPGPAADLYRAEGVETHVVQGIDDFSHTTLEWYGGRDLWRLPGKLMRIPGSISRTRALVERLHPDLVHLNSSTLAPSAIGAARAGVPVVWHIREPLARGYLGLRRAWIRRVVDHNADRVVAISGHDADQLIPSPRIHVIHNFVHFDRFDRSLTGESIRREFDIPAEAPIIAMLGGISEPKGTLTLIRTLPALIEAVPGVRVLVAGPPPHPLDEPGVRGLVQRALGVDAYPRAVARAIAELGPAARAALIFTGIRRDMPEILAASACLVFPSTVPHFARPVIEAAAMGVPSVASDLGGPRELIADGETGLLVPPRDPAALAAGIAALLSDPAHVRSFGEAAYRRARAMFDAGTNAAATVALYAEILDDRGNVRLTA
jgi:glycosyltransferase involved in cell wall biosynthesis